MDKESLQWVCGTWESLSEAIKPVRSEIFTNELGVDPAIDFDGSDRLAVHIVAFAGNQPVATGRLIPDEARIGRMAVATSHRHQGVGSELLGRIIAEAIRSKITEITLSAKNDVVEFYHLNGFTSTGSKFVEAGIEHQPMQISLFWREIVGALLIRDGLVLLGKRAPELKMGGLWDIFGGKIDAGESKLEAVKREIKEELGIKIEPDRKLDVIVYEDCDKQGWWRCSIYPVFKWVGELTINEEHSEAKWFTPEELTGFKLTHNQIRELVEKQLGVQNNHLENSLELCRLERRKKR